MLLADAGGRIGGGILQLPFTVALPCVDVMGVIMEMVDSAATVPITNSEDGAVVVELVG